MGTVEELEEALKKARRQERIKQLLENKRVLEQEFLGKCYATHTLTNKYTRVEAEAVKVERVVFNHYNYKFKGYSLQDLSDDDLKGLDCQLELRVVQYCKGLDTIAKTMYYRVAREYRSWNGAKTYQYEITEDEFNNIEKNTFSKVESLGDDLRRGLPKWDLYRTVSEDSAINAKVNRLKSVGMRFLEELSEEQVYELRSHPLLYGKSLLVSEASLGILVLMHMEAKEELNYVAALYDVGRVGVFRMRCLRLEQVINLMKGVVVC